MIRDRERGAEEVRDATRIVNRAPERPARRGRDPLVQEIGATRALAIRLGHGSGDELAEGRWTEAEPAAAAPPRPARRRRAAVTGRRGPRRARRGASRRDPDAEGAPGRPAGPTRARRATGCAPPGPRSRSEPDRADKQSGQLLEGARPRSRLRDGKLRPPPSRRARPPARARARSTAPPRRSPAGTNHQGRDRERCGDQAGADPEGQVEAAGQGCVGRAPARQQVVGASGREGRQDGEPERAADLERRVDQPGGEPRVLRRRARHREPHQRRERETRTHAEQEHRRQQVAEVARLDRREREQDQARLDQHLPRPTAPACAPKRITSRSEKPTRQDPDRERDRQEREADLERVVAEHPLEVEAAQEEHAEHPGDEQRLDRRWPRRRSGCGRCAAAPAACGRSPHGR